MSHSLFLKCQHFDIHRQIINLMNRNIALNLPDQSEDTEYGVQALELNWGDPIPEEIIQGDIDMILAADCVYSEVSLILIPEWNWIHRG